LKNNDLLRIGTALLSGFDTVIVQERA